jgi:hypothetical protein
MNSPRTGTLRVRRLDVANPNTTFDIAAIRHHHLKPRVANLHDSALPYGAALSQKPTHRSLW